MVHQNVGTNRVLSSNTLSTFSESTTSIPSFAVSYFINNLKFSSESALKASKLVHFKTSKKPDSVLNFSEPTVSPIQIYTKSSKENPGSFPATPRKGFSQSFNFYSPSLSVTCFLCFLQTFTEMSTIVRRGIHCLQRLNSANVSAALLEKGQNRVIDASLTLMRERAKLKGETRSQGSLTRSKASCRLKWKTNRQKTSATPV
ncbi:unnamed protein product [Vicia faba]|uniref:Uncharacterized protein n=1 Tax=Vicia faba TaxID=3906 RepID=A0AAV0ZCC6_VICFA|nr:unnamed protein product [Vicia faba]